MRSFKFLCNVAEEGIAFTLVWSNLDIADDAGRDEVIEAFIKQQYQQDGLLFSKDDIVVMEEVVGQDRTMEKSEYSVFYIYKQGKDYTLLGATDLEDAKEHLAGLDVTLYEGRVRRDRMQDYFHLTNRQLFDACKRDGEIKICH